MNRRTRIEEPARTIPVLGDFDVVVCGGGAAGCAAAVASARLGAETLLIEKDGYLGGATVSQLVIHILSTNGVDFQGIWHEWIRALRQRGGACALVGQPPQFRSGVDPEVVKYAWDDLLTKAGARQLLHSWCSEAIVEEGVCRGVVVETRAGRQAILAGRVVDCTADGAVCAAAGVPWEQGDGAHPWGQALTKFLRMGNVRWPEGGYTPEMRHAAEEALAAAVERGEYDSPVVANGRVITYATSSGVRHSVLPYRTEMNVVASRVLKVDPLDPWDLTRAEREGREQAWQCADFLKRYVPGYEQAYLLDTNAHIGLRDSRRIRGITTVTGEDALQFRKHPDGIARSSWDIDIWPAESYDAPAVDRESDAYEARKARMLAGDYFDIPYGCLVASGVDNLLMAGRCISAERIAQASLRIQQTCQSTGQAAGVAAALSLQNGVTPRQMDPAIAIANLAQARDVEPAFTELANIPLAGPAGVRMTGIAIECDAADSPAPLWQVAEIALTSAKSYPNPYGDVDLTVTFSGPGDETISRPAFWDGGDLWRVRFAPTATGNWHWRSVCSDTGNTGLHGQIGELRCVPSSSDNQVYRHGFLRVSDNRRHFVHVDGTPFFWLGDTHWQMPDTERLDACNHPEHSGAPCPHGGQFQHLVADRKARGFTVYQTYPSATAAHWWTTPYSQIDPERFRRVFDAQVDHLAERGFVIALGCGHFNNSTTIPETDLCRWARYLVARYGAHPIVWITCQEMNAPAEMGGRESNRIGVWRAVAREIARGDGYGHPHSAHQWVLDAATDPLGQEPWHDWFALQGGHRNSGLTPQARYQGYYGFQATRPVLETEAMYELVDCGGVNTTDEARQSAWKAMLCGGAGYTYGSAGIWALKWDEKDTRWMDYNHAIGSWYEGMALPGAAQMALLRDFFAALPWPALTPRFGDPAWAEWGDAERCVLATDGNRLYLAYCYGETSGGTLKGLDRQAAYTAQWFDPRSGAATVIAESFHPSTGCWTVPEKPTGDWVLRVDIEE